MLIAQSKKLCDPPVEEQHSRVLRVLKKKNYVCKGEKKMASWRQGRKPYKTQWWIKGPMFPHLFFLKPEGGRMVGSGGPAVGGVVAVVGGNA